jgi:uncharacterized damage-inducible protein DinB
MDTSTLISGIEFSRNRLLGTLDGIEKAAAEKGQDLAKVMAWRPGAGRAHIAWQVGHCAATHDKYVNVALKGQTVKDAALVADFGGGSTPSDTNVPSLAALRTKLESSITDLKAYVRTLDATGLARMVPGANNTQRSVGEAIQMLTWHEAHHQGQIHLTWNLYKAAHGFA